MASKKIRLFTGSKPNITVREVKNDHTGKKEWLVEIEGYFWGILEL